jgi:hypothetical protein
MFARIQTVRTTDLPEGGAAPPREFCDVLRMHPAYAGAYFLTDIVAATRMLLTLWGNRADAERSSERTRERMGEPPFRPVSDRIVEVVGDRPGPSTATPTGGGLAEFDGPLSDERRAEIEQAADGWVADIWAGVPGSVRMITMWDPEARATVVLNVGETGEAAEAAGRAIRAAAPDHRTEPDRVAVCRVDHVETVTPVAG